MDKYEIKKNVIDNICEYYNHDGLTRGDADIIFNCYVIDDDLTPQEVYKSADIDTDKLFGQTPSFIGKYLAKFEKKFGVGTLEQRWSGYEDNYFIYEYKGLEDDGEIVERICQQLEKNIKKYLREKEEKSAKEKKIKELEKELAELRRSN